MRFGEFLLHNGTITQSNLDDALKAQKFQKSKLGRVLKKLNAIDSIAHNTNLALFFDLPTLSNQNDLLKEADISEFTDNELNEALRYNLLPLNRNDNVIRYLSKEYCDEFMEQMEGQGKNVELVKCTEEVFDFMSKDLFGIDRTNKKNRITVSKVKTDDERLSDESPYVQLIKTSIEAAQREGISDIHITPWKQGVEIRFRKNGELSLWKEVNSQFGQAFLEELKRVLGLRIDQFGKTQDKAFNLENINLRIRVSLMPTLHGENIVLRLIELNQSFDLKSSGLEKNVVSTIEQSIQSKSGIILLSGPTGSGKTTTLQAILSEVDREKLRIVTVEDPIEVVRPGIVQIEVSDTLKFSDALRGILRQDPDVILLGEIRDEETADLAFKAAATGHLVLSTVHANGAIEAVDRLRGLGVKEFLIESCLKFSGAQRLLKKLCHHCATEIEPTEASYLLVGNSSKSVNLKTRNSEGCPKCNQGLSGRIPIMEVYTPAKDGVNKSLMEITRELAWKGVIDANEALFSN